MRDEIATKGRRLMMATTVTIHVAKSAIDALVMDRLHHPPPQVQREFQGEHEGCRFRLRWTRPALTFPDDAPDMVRIGLAFEGGVQLASGRVLSCDTFITATAAPRLTNDENGWFVRLTPEHIEPGEIHLTYAGAALGTMRGQLGSDLPDDATLAGLREVLATAIVRFYEEFPDIPLTYGFPTHAIAPEAVAVQVYSETHGRALIITLTVSADAAEIAPEDATNALPQFFATTLQNLAITVSADAFSAAFARGWAVQSSPREDVIALTATFDGEIILFTGEAATGPEQHEAFSLWAYPEITEDGALIFARVGSETDPADAAIVALIDDVTLHESLARLTERALQDILTPVLGKPGDALTWFWHVVRGAAPGMLRFTPQGVQVAADTLVLVGDLPVEPATQDLPDDGPNCDLRVVRGSDDPLDDDTPAFTVRVTQQQGVVAPCDYVWQWSLSPVLAEHGPLLKVPATLAEGEP
ncbi:MAG TPA: hypothetical protein VKB76_07880, partial [Ktedonobacterales bacterium]|nr:hypothetical protein [Ktedonobacterales bacterium]